MAWGVALFIVVNVAANLWLPERLEPWSDPAYFVRLQLLSRRLREHASISPHPGTIATTASAKSPRLVTAFGSSRFLGGLDGKVFEDVLRRRFNEPCVMVNFASPGAGPLDSYVRLNRLLRDGHRPDLVLIEILPNQLNVGPGAIAPVAPASRFSAADEACLLEANLAIPTENRLQRSSIPLALCSYRLELLRAVSPKMLDGGDVMLAVRSNDPSGSSLIRGPVTHERRQVALQATRREYQQGATEFRLGGDGLAALEATLQVCRNEGLTSILVVMPEGPELRGWYRWDAENELRNTLRQLAHRWDTRVIDCWQFLETEESFVDSHHLVAEAASQFTTELAEQAFADSPTDANYVRVAARPAKTESR